MNGQNLDFISSVEGREVVRQMLTAVVDHPQIHRNLFRYDRQHDGSWEYFVGLHGSGASAFPRGTRLPINVVEQLVVHGWAEGTRETGFREGWYRFTDMALDWYRRNSGPTDDQVRSVLGHHFLHLDQRRPNDPQRFDVAAIAQELGFDEQRVMDQTRFLVGARMLEDVSPRGAKMPKFYRLSQPDGFRWAAGGFGSIAGLGSTTVNVQVDVTINITNFLLGVGALDIPEELKREVAEVAQDLQREPTIEKLGKLMEFGANAVTGAHAVALVPPIAQFIVDNGPTILRFLGQFPVGIPLGFS